MPDDTRPYDIVLFGATGFAGRLTAQYLARNAPDTCRWAIAGRSRKKLAAVREDLAEINPACADLPLLLADVNEPGPLRALAGMTRVLVTTVGPYVQYGESLVAACADAGTDYLDLTGEPEFFDRCYVRYHARAVETGARIIHAAGFDSIPYDLGVLYTVQQLPADVPISVRGYIRTMAMFSGGTFATALLAASRPWQNVRARIERVRAEGRPAGRRVRTPLGLPGRSRDLGTWVVPMPSLDPQIVARSAGALVAYGPDFTYRQYAAIKRLPTLIGMGAGLAPFALLAQLPPARRLLSKMLGPGDGPSEERRAKSWFSATFVGEGGGKRAVVEVAGGDPGYDETAKMLGESALCLAFDELQPTAGQVTTAIAMGDALIARLQRAGLVFQTLDAPKEPRDARLPRL